MNMKNAFFAAFIFFAAVYAWKVMQTTTAPATPSAEAKSAPLAEKKLSSSAVLRIDPKASSGIQARTDIPQKPLSTDVQQFRERRDLPALYARLKAGAQTPEALYLQAEILDRCAKRPPSPNTPPGTREERREKFLAGLSGTPEQKALRTAAYDQLTRDTCGELAKIERNPAEIEKLRADAAAAGDVRAQAWQLSADIIKASEDAETARRAGKGPGQPGGGPAPGAGNVITDEQWKTLQGLLASGEVGALNELRGVLASTVTDGTIRLGPDQAPVDQRALWTAVGLLGCDLGNPCGADNRDVLSACVYSGRCGSSNLFDHTYFYEASPHIAQLMESYRQSLADMIRRGDFSQLRLVRGQPNTNNVSIFRGR